MFKRIDHVEIVPSDIERTIAFYTEILGFKIKHRKKFATPPRDEIVFLELGDTLLELFSVKNPAPLSTEEWQIGFRGIALEVKDVVKAIEYLKKKGVKIVLEPVSSEGSPMRARIEDPDGLPIELRQM